MPLSFSYLYRSIASIFQVAIVFTIVSCSDPRLVDDARGTERSADQEATSERAEEKSMLPDSGLWGRSSKSIPCEVVVESVNGKALAGILLAKKGEEIVVRRSSDERLFLLNLEALSRESREEMSAFSNAEEEKLIQFKGSSGTVTSRAPSRPLLGADFSDDYNAALQKAEGSGKNVMLIFLGDNTQSLEDSGSIDVSSGSSGQTTISAAVAISQSFNNGVVKSGTFRFFANDHFEPVLINLSEKDRSNLEYPNEKTYEELRKKFVVQDFPTVVIASPEGRYLESIVGYDRKGPAIYVREMEKHLGSLMSKKR